MESNSRLMPVFYPKAGVSSDGGYLDPGIASVILYLYECITRLFILFTVYRDLNIILILG